MLSCYLIFKPMKKILIRIIFYLFLLNILYSLPPDYFIANRINFEKNDMSDMQNRNTKKVVAMGLSALFPGAGHFYLGQSKVGAVYTGIELAGWIIKEDYNRKIDRSSKIYKEYAREHWSLAKWIKDYFNPTVDSVKFNCNDGSSACVTFRDLDSQEVYESFLKTGSFSYPWLQSHTINFYYNSTGTPVLISTKGGNFETIYSEICNTSLDENFICFNEDGEVASLEDIEEIINNGDLVYDHHLYEGISKYNMYFAGWDDSELGYMQKVGSDYNVVYSPLKKEYENNLRANHKKNNEQANNVLSAILINHAVSVFDIILRNKNMVMSAEGQFNHDGKYGVNKINFSIGIN